MADFIRTGRKNSAHKGEYYGRAVDEGTVTEYDLAKAIEAKCTIHRADVVAVIIALIDEMTRALQSSQRVKLSGFGTLQDGYVDVRQRPLRSSPPTTSASSASSSSLRLRLLKTAPGPAP